MASLLFGCEERGFPVKKERRIVGPLILRSFFLRFFVDRNLSHTSGELEDRQSSAFFFS